LDGSYEPDRYEDRYRDEVMAVIERKARGEAIEPPEREQVTREVDLLDVLKQSIEQHGARKRGTSHSPAGKRSPRKPAAAKPSASKRTANKTTKVKQAKATATKAKRAPAKRGGS
jgi:DNA end-binding protein Ku